MAVLMLNATYEPMHVISLRRAVALLALERAQLVETSGRVLRSPSLAIPEPLVIRLRHPAPAPRRWHVPITRTAILLRDEDTCQYCGAQPGRHELTVDHVIPASRGGQWTWTNLVTACKACNAAKGNRTPEEAGMALRRPPGKPRFGQAVPLRGGRLHPAWRPYLWT
ncbi:MAG: HNH endonuclease [Caldilineales bacterium]|nr:HNH endonuclease [Caldilineales bacterium]MDW8317227.1 HNH endonuclease [Anaerolineae bacterium]